MNPLFLSLTEAAEKTGRSGSTIRRFIKSIVDSDSHPDREAVLPSPAQVVTFKKKGENFGWKIREDVLLKNLPPVLREEKKVPEELTAGVLGILRNELELKNRQIEKQFEVIQSLNERLREGNILMGSLQQRLALPAQEQTPEKSVEASSVPSSAKASAETSKEAAVKAFKKTSANLSKKAAKGGLFSWFRAKEKVAS